MDKFALANKSTISREIRRNRGQRSYRPNQSHNKAISRRKEKVHQRIDDERLEFIESLISEDWSPEQVSGWMKKEMPYSVSHEWIYQHIYLEEIPMG